KTVRRHHARDRTARRPSPGAGARRIVRRRDADAAAQRRICVEPGGKAMIIPRRTFLHLAAGTAGAVALPAVIRRAQAHDYPTRPVRVIVGFPAGSGPDIVARIVGQSLSERMGQSFVIEDRPGAASNIATEAVVRATPDGYTLLLITTANTINATLYDRLNF